MATSAERQKKHREQMRLNGLLPVTAYVPEWQRGDVQAILRLLAERPHLEIAVLRDTVTGQYVSIKG